MARAAAGLGHDSRDRQIAQAHGLAREDLVRDQDDRRFAVGLRALGRRRPVPHRQVRADPRDHVADVGQPLAEIFLLLAGERRRIILQDRLQRRERRELVQLDQVPDLGPQRLVLHDREVRAEDRRLGRAQLLANFGDDRLQFIGRSGDGAVKPLDLGADKRRIGQAHRLAGAEDRLDPMDHAHDHARTDRDTLLHEKQFSLAGHGAQSGRRQEKRCQEPMGIPADSWCRSGRVGHRGAAISRRTCRPRVDATGAEPGRPRRGGAPAVAGDGVIRGVAFPVHFRMISSRCVAMISLCSSLTTTPSLPEFALIADSREGRKIAGRGAAIGCRARGRIRAESGPTHSFSHGFS